MTVVQNYGLFFLLCYVHGANPTFYRSFTFLVYRPLSPYFCTFYTKMPTPAISAKCQTFLTSVSVLGRTFSPPYLYMEGTNGGQKNEQ